MSAGTASAGSSSAEVPVTQRLTKLDEQILEGHGPLEKLEKFNVNEFNPWQISTDRRLGELEEFTGKMHHTWGVDQSNNENRLNKLEKQFKDLVIKTTATHKRVDDGCTELKAAIKDLGQKIETSTKSLKGSGTANRVLSVVGSPGQFNDHSPGAFNVRFDHNRDVLINGASGTGQAQGMLLAPSNYPGAKLLLPYPANPSLPSAPGHSTCAPSSSRLFAPSSPSLQLLPTEREGRRCLPGATTARYSSGLYPYDSADLLSKRED